MENLQIKKQIGSKRFNNIKNLANAYLEGVGKLSNSTVDMILWNITLFYDVLTHFTDRNYFDDMCDLDIASDVYGCAYNRGITYMGQNIGFSPTIEDDLYEALEKEVRS